jgi:transcriptional regulator GlxA family with amidase domain
MTAVGLYLYHDVEVLDFAGPFEVFSTAARMQARLGAAGHFEVFTISNDIQSVRARGGLRVSTQYSLHDHPALDVLIIPGGDVSAELQQSDVIRWIATTARSTRVTASVCTGALLLAAASLLDGKRATTHWEDADALQRDFPTVRVQVGPRWIDEGEVVTSAGISAGIDMSLHLVRRLAGAELARTTARQMDFDWTDRGA